MKTLFDGAHSAIRAARRSGVVFLVVAGLIAAGCVSIGSSDDDSALPSDRIGSSQDLAPTEQAPTEQAPTEQAPTEQGTVDVGAFEPEFDEESCDDSLPTDIDIKCGVVTVPSSWEDGSGEIKLSVAVVESDSDSSIGPVINLEGGPGGHSLQTLTFVVDDVVTPLLEMGDVVFFDQRGVGLSEPQLSCGELTELSRRYEDEVDVDDDQATEEFYSTLEDCRDRLIDEGNVLNDYNSINNAHDVEAIRIALGYEQWNLLGVSYGTKLALEVMRQHPNNVRSAILDSVYPPQVDSTRDNPATFLASYNKVLQACADEPECAAGGDLGDRLRAVIAELEEKPVRLEVEDWITGETDEIYADGEDLAGLVTSALYSPSQFTDLPELVSQLENRQTEGLSSFLSQDRTGERFFTVGMFYAIACQEEISFADPDEVEAALPDDPFGIDDKFDLASNTGTGAFKTCAAFENGIAPAESNMAVTSDTPTLLLTGDFDPVTPTAWAELAAETLPNSHVVVAKNGSHGISGDECGSSIVREFLTEPQARPDAGCLDEKTLNFVARSSEEVVLEEFSFDVEDGKTLASVRPEGWRVGTLDGDQYRDASFLDPTVFFQLSADEDLALGIEFYVEGSDVSLGRPAELTGSVGPIKATELDQIWTRREGTGDGIRAEWFETTIEGQPVQVILITTVEEYEANLEEIVLPAMMSLEVS